MLNEDLELIKGVGCGIFVDCLANGEIVCKKDSTKQNCRIIYFRYCNFKSGGNAPEANKNLKILMERRGYDLEI